MSRLNAPRELPYDFHVVAIDGEVWLYDKSEHVHACSLTPCYDMEPLYALGVEAGDECSLCHHGLIQDEDPPTCGGLCGTVFDGLAWSEPCLRNVREVLRLESIKVELDNEYISPSVPRREAWDAAREEANANHLL